MGRPLEELDVLDDFMMNAVVSNPDCGKAFCRRTLSVLLQRQIGELNIVSQRVIPALSPELRGIRLDVEITESEQDSEGDVHNVYDMEPHLRKDKNLPKRNRFYQAKIDSRYMKRGEDDFSKLPNLYVITITNYDPFGEDYMMYTISNHCEEIEELEYNDGLKFIYFYAGGHKGGNKAIRALLRYFQKSTKDNVVDDATREIHEYVSKTKLNPKVRDEYMRLDEAIEFMVKDAKEAAMAEGRAAGMAEGKAITLIQLIYSKHRKGKALSEIADELEMEISDIQLMYDTIVKCGEAVDAETVYDIIKNQ